MQKIVSIEATTLPDSWFQLIYNILEYGRDFKIDQGSFAGSIRKEFDFVVVHIKRPYERDSEGFPLIPDVPEGSSLAPPVDKPYLAQYAPYLLTGEIADGESYCYDDETEILTKKGWILFKDYIENFDKRVEVATLNPINELIWQIPVNYNEMDYNGDMYEFKSTQIDMCVTPNHTMYVSEVNKNQFELKKSNELNLHRYKFKKDCIWNGEEKEYFILPKVEYNNPRYKGYGEERKIPMDLWLKFFGIWLADGSLRKQKNKYAIVITKRNEEQRQIIIPVLNEIFGPVTIHDKDLIVDDKQIHSYLLQFGLAGDKYIPEEILNLSSRQLKILFDFMYMCDGSKPKYESVKYSRYNSKSKRMIDNCQELCLKIGLSGNVRKDSGVYRLNINNDNDRTMANVTPCISLKDNVKIKKYNGKVYCVEVSDYHILYVRRNGIPCWCGNTYGQRLNNEKLSRGEVDETIRLKNTIYRDQCGSNELGSIIYQAKGLSQVDLAIEIYREYPRTNQMCLQVAKPKDMLLLDPPCLRHIDTRIQDGKLHFYPYFRSWDLYSGYPANVAGISMLQEHMANEIGCEQGEMICTSKGLHLYDITFPFAKARCMIEGKC